MPVLILLLMAVVSNAQAQKLVLMDRDFREPMQYHGSSAEPAHLQMFPVYQSDIETVMKMTQWFINKLEESHTTPDINQIKEAGSSRFIASTGSIGQVPSFQLNLVTRCGNTGYSMQLINANDGHKKRLQKLRAFLDYLRNNQFLVTATQ